ncbi:MAG: PCRF domain-containing protein, partial [bacterium]
MYGGVFDLAGKKEHLVELEKELSRDGLWDDPQAAGKLLQEQTRIKGFIKTFEDLRRQFEDLDTLVLLYKEEQDHSLEGEILQEIKDFRNALDEVRLKTILSGEVDQHNALVTIHPGAGGTESQDWAEMLLRMYTRWAERRGFKFRLSDLLPGDEAGIKSATFFVEGDYAFGYLKAESGIHRLVRISPFDSNKRRHTSFASIFVWPEIDEQVKVDINPADLRIDTYRSSGAG